MEDLEYELAPTFVKGAIHYFNIGKYHLQHIWPDYELLSWHELMLAGFYGDFKKPNSAENNTP